MNHKPWFHKECSFLWCITTTTLIFIHQDHYNSSPKSNCKLVTWTHRWRTFSSHSGITFTIHTHSAVVFEHTGMFLSWLQERPQVMYPCPGHRSTGGPEHPSQIFSLQGRRSGFSGSTTQKLFEVKTPQDYKYVIYINPSTPSKILAGRASYKANTPVYTALVTDAF